jgi:chromosome segregation protein
MKLKRKRIFERKVSAQDIINNLRISKARLEAELENIKLEFENYKKTETYRLPLETLRSRISMTMNAIKSLGAINMKALEEFKQERIIFNDLREKVDKLAEERNKVLEMIAEIEGRRKGVFEKTLEGIREQFKIVFKDLTGGQADIKLEGDTLEGGLLIEASPAGKKLLNIDAMSGGEKTLAALAFLFAVQRYRPAPFYILDEIDAALDKPNTKKTVELIKKYCDNAQFIVITHNDATIKEAGCVYGVSMDNGESRLVGIRMPS